MKAKFQIGNIFKGDGAIWIIYLLLSIISLISVYSSIGLYAIADYGTTPIRLFFKHAIFVFFSYVAIIFITPAKTNTLYRIADIVFIVSIVLVIVAAIQSTRWISVAGIRFQPSEVVKLGLTLFIARKMQQHRNELESPKFFGMMLLIIVAVAVCVFPENLSTAALIFVASMMALMFSGVRFKYWIITMAIFLVAGILGLFIFYKLGNSISLFRSSTWVHRIDSWLNPTNELTQENMAKMAIARGGLTGNGIGQTIHARLMTQAHNDFIFAIIIEEMGSIAGIFIFALYTLFFRRCIRLVKKCKDIFSATIVGGFGSIIYLQALINMSVAVGLLPVTGQTLPFISYGGTAYLILSLGIGMIQCVAYNIKKEESKNETEPAIE